MSLIFTAIIFYSGIALSDLNKISGKLAWMIHNSAVSTLSSSPLWVIPRNHEYFVKEIMLSFTIQKINILFYPTPEWHSSQSPRSEPCSDTVISLFFCSWNAVIWIYFRSTCQLSFAQPYRQNSWSPEYANLVYWNYALRIPCQVGSRLDSSAFAWWLFAVHNLLNRDHSSCIQNNISVKGKVIPQLKVLITLRLTPESPGQKKFPTLAMNTTWLETNVWFFFCNLNLFLTEIHILNVNDSVWRGYIAPKWYLQLLVYWQTHKIVLAEWREAGLYCWGLHGVPVRIHDL